MGYSTVSIPFFNQDIAIKPHTATSGKYIGCKITIGQFCGKQRGSLEQIQETGEYIVRRQDGEVIEGPEV